MYKVIHWFRDMQDENHLYSVGDSFPRSGVSASDERIEELASNKNKLRIPLIAEMAEGKKRKK